MIDVLGPLALLAYGIWNLVCGPACALRYRRLIWTIPLVDSPERIDPPPAPLEVRLMGLLWSLLSLYWMVLTWGRYH